MKQSTETFAHLPSMHTIFSGVQHSPGPNEQMT